MEINQEGMRQLLELAICCGRGWQSPQTGYVHYYYNLQDEAVHHPIPIYENFLFVLALMRSRLSDNIIEAKELLKRLLRFQCVEGNAKGHFPIYLHEYPECKDRLIWAQLIPPLFWIYKHFHHILGADLKEALREGIVGLQEYSLQVIENKPVPYSFHLRAALFAQAVGLLFERKDFVQKGIELEKVAEQNRDESIYYSPLSLSDLIVAYQMMNQNLSNSNGILDRLNATWHVSGSYCGCAWKEYQKGFEPQVTLYDFFMGYWTGKYSARCFIDHPVQLQAALLQPFEGLSFELNYPRKREGVLQALPWQTIQFEKMALSVIAKENAVTSVNERVFAPLKMIWGSIQRLHSMVCQGAGIRRASFDFFERGVDLHLTLSEDQLEPHEKNQEVSFYIDDDQSISINVEGSSSTTFMLNEKIVITEGNNQWNLSFALEEGQGAFFGHIIKGNRPCQLALVGTQRFMAFDKHIYLRTLKRTPDCTIKASLSWKGIDAADA